ncbi:MAG: tetratricopeptide repeat protein [Planctomycetota bacterium]|nr:tetratricopeptide repeat protein [Planctomycetota bacterium]
MLDITPESLTFRSQCIEEFAGDTLDRIIMRIHCDACEFAGENSALVATTGFGFESIKQLREVVERIVSEGDLSCPECDDPLVELVKVYYMAYSETLELDFIAEFDPPSPPHNRWLLGCYMRGESTERISVADTRLPQIFRETLLRAAASASELGNNPELAKKLIARSVELFGHCPRDRYLLATVCRENSEFAEALECLTDLVEDQSECQRSLFEIGVTHFAALRAGQDQLVEAFTAFSTVLEINDTHAPAHLYLGNLYLGLGRFSESLEHFEAAALAEIDMMEAHFNAGIALLNLNRPNDALNYFETARELSPTDADVAKRMAESLEALGRGDEAVEWHTQAEALANGDESIEGTLEDLGLL